MTDDQVAEQSAQQQPSTLLEVSPSASGPQYLRELVRFRQAGRRSFTLLCINHTSRRESEYVINTRGLAIKAAHTEEVTLLP